MPCIQGRSLASRRSRTWSYLAVCLSAWLTGLGWDAAHAQAPTPTESKKSDDQNASPDQSKPDAADTNGGKTSSTADPAVPVVVEKEDAREHLTAADVLQALQRQRPEQRIIAPEGKLLMPRDARRDQLLPEGYPVVDISGSIRWESPWWVFAPDETHDLKPMKLLPNAILEPMARSAGRNGEGQSEFSVYGSVTEFAGENYIFAQFVARRDARRATAASQVLSPTGNGPANGTVAGGSTESPSNANARSTTADGDVDDIMTALEAQRPSVDPLSIVAVTQAHSPSTAEEAKPSILPEGEPVSSRLGRLIRAGEWWTLVFESETDKPGELPLRLLPNRNLERMIQHNVDDTSGTLFVVSGRLTIFEGQNYLLTRSAQQPVASDNLRR
ncbi:MAG: hypothetical protein ACPGXK_16820 [Phycisphaerae bacterium]